VSAGIPADRYGERLDAVRTGLGEAGAETLLCGPGADLEWLIGYDIAATERLTMLVLPRQGDPILVVPRLELEIACRAPGVASSAVTTRTWEETEDALDQVADALGGQVRGELLVGDALWATFLLRLEARFPDARLGASSRVLRPLRAVKDAEEVGLLREAAHAADRVVEALASGRLVGRSERDLAREVRERLVGEGHEVASFWTVAGGENSAAPHHLDSDRVIRPGEPLLFDIGGRLGGYFSDITRTIWVSGEGGSGPDEAFSRLYGVVERAQAAAREAARPGVPCESIDRAARSIVEADGFGDRFLHRTGHGIGLEVHEHPYLVAGNDEPLRPGHAFSVEPGIYLEGRYGARIEDIVVCGPERPEILNEAPRDLLVVSGL
jgi:Xaa-Pro aminopeptidase